MGPAIDLALQSRRHYNFVQTMKIKIALKKMKAFLMILITMKAIQQFQSMKLKITVVKEH